MYVEFILTIIIIRYLRRMLRKEGVLPDWNRLLIAGIVVSFGLLLVGIIVSRSEHIATVLTDIMLLYIVYITFTRKEFLPAKSLIYAVLPYIIVSLVSGTVELISYSFYDEWNNYFDTAQLLAVIWMIATWVMTRKQRKALDTERLKALEKEKEYKITESLKAELEVQVADRTAALTLQKEALQQALDELKATQAQLIQSEKMASLGELTAGIAHEIQNPLNFVNNFSEVNTELITEMKDAIDKGDLEEVKAIATDIMANEQKINHHGKRADAIVKGMLQHSRSSGGQKEPTDINALADEYLRLAYHGLRAKDKTFNASMKTDFDTHIGSVQVIPQDIGRVILNLITNAFYAVTEKKLSLSNSPADKPYDPTVSVSTKKYNGMVEIKVQDNGNGVPTAVLDKIFQPFFTTKPTGEGTGLGLSMSYDIVTKGHGGELKVETKENEGSVFIIQLPVQA
jgi:two-component system, NtrC family, sensor kinase